MQKSKFNVSEKDGEYYLTQSHTKSMKFKEAIQTLAKMEQDIAQGMKQVEKMQDEIKNKVHESNLKDYKEQIENIVQLRKEWQCILKSEIEQYKKKIIADIKVMKAERGYSRAREENQKIAMSSAIMSEIAVKYDLDVGYLFMREIKKDFDKI
ncbi:MAG: hypothetical protein ACOYWZ_13395 [Bacillota bacterium]